MEAGSASFNPSTRGACRPVFSRIQRCKAVPLRQGPCLRRPYDRKIFNLVFAVILLGKIYTAALAAQTDTLLWNTDDPDPVPGGSVDPRDAFGVPRYFRLSKCGIVSSNDTATSN